MRRYRNIILAAAVIVAVLAGAWVWGGRAQPDAQLTIDNGQWTIEDAETKASPTPSETPRGVGDAAPYDAASALETTPSPEAMNPNPSPEATPQLSIVNSQLSIDPSPTQDEYLTDPAPSGKPTPVEPQDAALGGGAFTVTLSVRCNNILNNMNLLDKEKHELVPADGVIFPATVVTVYEGESVFNVLQREMKRAKIHMEFMNTPIYNSAYIEGIGNLYEFDVGELSGWMYAVNGWYPNYGCSRYQLTAGDVIEWSYTCDLGRDLGQTWIDGGQRDE
jgi:hypothetical protein